MSFLFVLKWILTVLACIVAASSAFDNITLESSTSLFMWKDDKPSFRMYPKNKFGRVVWEHWTDVNYDSFSQKGVVCTTQLGLTSLGSGWAFSISDPTEMDPALLPSSIVTASKALGGGVVTFSFITFGANGTLSVYNDQLTLPVHAGSMKMSVLVQGWNFNILSDCLEFNWDVQSSEVIDSAQQSLLGSLLNILSISTSTLSVTIVSPLSYMRDNGGLITLVLNVVGGLLNALLNQNNGMLNYRFAKFQQSLVYDPDYSILLKQDPLCPAHNECNGNGDCVYANECQCSQGWSGLDCSITVCPSDCSGKGSCQAGNPPYCACDPGWFGLDCSNVDCPGEPNCNNRGSCNIEVEPHQCECNEGWTGNECSIPDCPGSPDCSSHGICNSTVAVPVCECNNNWNGEDCSVPVCPGSPACSGNGECSDMFAVPLCECNSHFGGPECSQVFNCTSDSECNRGICDLSQGLCICDKGWTGTECQTAICPGYDPLLEIPNCFARGQCSPKEELNECLCNEGWQGIDCSSLLCPGMNCSGNGECISSAIPPQCSCFNGWTGQDCSEAYEAPNVSRQDLNEGEVEENGKSTVIFMATGIALGAACILVVVGMVLVEVYRKREGDRVTRALQVHTTVAHNSESNYTASVALRGSNPTRSILKKSPSTLP